MVVFNYSGAEINAKVVYYGPALSGKTTNLECIYAKMPDDTKGKMVSMKTRTDRTLFFDFLPLDVGEINGYQTRILLYTVPGQVYYNATRKLVLKGADAVVFVADSDPTKMEGNIDSLRNLEENLNEHGLTLDTMPWVIQYNKRDLPGALPVDQLASRLNLLDVPSFEASAATGQGVYETFRGIAGLLYKQLVERLKNEQPGSGSSEATPSPETAYATPPEAQATATAPSATDVQSEPIAPPPELQTEPTPPASAPAEPAPPVQPKTQSPPPFVEPTASTNEAATFQQEDGDDTSLTDVVDAALREVEPASGDNTADVERPISPVPSTAAPEATPGSAAPSTGPALDGKLDLAGSGSTSDDMGRLVDFQDSQPQAVETADGEFITDPFRSDGEGAAGAAEPPLFEPADKPAAAKPVAKPADKPAAAKPVAKPAADKPVAKPAAETAAMKATKTAAGPVSPSDPASERSVLVDDIVTVTVPVFLTRSQMQRTVPIQIELEIQITDEES